MREYHSTGGLEYKSDEVKNMFLRNMLPCDDKKKLTHREFAEGAVGTLGETYEQLRMRVVETISREELEHQHRVGGVLAADAYGEDIYEGYEGGGGADEGDMEEEEVHGLMAALDSGILSLEQVNAVQRKFQKRGR